MRRITSLSLSVVILCVCSTVSAKEAPAKKGKKGRRNVERLFDGKSLAGWDCVTGADDVKMEDVWSVEDGILVCKGEPLGYLVTKKDYTDYRLTVVWRWAPDAGPGNSGILLRIAGDAVSFLPKCAECQLKAGSAGDVYGFYGCEIKGDKERFGVIESDALGKILAVKKTKDVEKKPGKWNKAEITVDGGTITVVINGEQVNQATDCNVATGKIGLQSEGGEIHFRRVTLVPLKK